MPKRIAYILSNLNKALAFEWIAEELDQKQFPLIFILLNPGDSALEDFLRARNIPVFRFPYHGKKDLVRVVPRLTRLLKREKVQLVHCHLFDASLAGLLAASWLRMKARIYTRHHATLHHEYFPRAVYYDRFVNFLASDMVAISENVKHILVAREQVKEEKVHVIPHGFRLEKFEEVKQESVQELKKKHGLEEVRGPVIGVIARQTHWKGIQYTIEAFIKLVNDYPEAHLLLANAQGDYQQEIRNQLEALPAPNYTQIVFEPDIYALYRLFDVYVHVPIHAEAEAFGQTYVEALAAGVPSVFTLSGIAREFIVHEKNALVVPFQDSGAIYRAIRRLLEEKEGNPALLEEGRKSVQALFSLEGMIRKLENLYRVKLE